MEPREQPVSFHERSADASMREEYAIVIDRQLKLLKYLDAALERIDTGVMVSAYAVKNSSHNNGSKQYRTRNSALGVKVEEAELLPGKARIHHAETRTTVQP